MCFCIGHRTYPIGGDCKVPTAAEIPDSAFPLFVKFGQGLHSTGGWGGQCVRDMQHVQDREELALKMIFFSAGKACGATTSFEPQPSVKCTLTFNHSFSCKLEDTAGIIIALMTPSHILSVQLVLC